MPTPNIMPIITRLSISSKKSEPLSAFRHIRIPDIGVIAVAAFRAIRPVTPRFPKGVLRPGAV